MKLLYVAATYAPAWTYGGVVASSHRMYEAIASQGEDVTVYTTDAGLPSDDEGARTGFRLMNGVKVHYFKCDWRGPILSHSLTRQVQETIADFDLMHLAGVWQPSSIGVRRAAVKAGCPYVVGFHGALDPWSREHGRMKKLLYYLVAERKNIGQASGIRYTSKMESDSSSRFARPGQEQRIIPNGIDFGSWFRDVDAARRWRAEAGLPSDRFLLISVGRLHVIKGLELAINALASLRAQSWHLAFIGKDEDGTGAKLKRQVSDLGLAERVTFHSTVPESQLRAIYSAGDLFILPSCHENFANTVLEALTCECPVLISDQVGISGDLLGINGVVVRKRDISLWREALKGALDGQADFKISTGDRPELERRFSIANCARKMTEFHYSVLGRSRPVR